MDFMNILQLLGWATVGAVMILFALTGGFDFGAGILLPFVAKNDEERRVVVNTVGPTWDGNQVWLITAGGAIFAIWPRVYAASFSGFYFAFLMVLWALFLRPVSFEYRSKMPSQKWRSFWDWALFVGSLLPALLIGVAIGNLFLGVPFQYDPITLRFFYGSSMQDTNAMIDLFGLLRPFALFTGVVSVVMMIMHGASYLCMRTEGAVYARCKAAQRSAALVLIVLFAVGGLILMKMTGQHIIFSSDALNHPLNGVVTASQGGWLSNYNRYPFMILAPIAGFLGALGVRYFSKKRAVVRAFLASSLALIGVISTMGLSLYPFIMPSSNFPAQSLEVYNASSSQTSLMGILIVAVVMLPIIFVYTAFVYKKLWGRGERMSVERIRAEGQLFY